MKSRASLFNKTLFFKNLRRFAPLWGIFAGILFLSGPMLLMQTRTEALQLTAYATGRRYTVLCMNFAYALLCAALPFRYLHKAQSAYMMHAFPISRAAQFCTNVLSGLCFALVPYALQLVLNLLCAVGTQNPTPLYWLFAYETLSFLCFYGIAVFCMLLTGRTVIGVISYAALNFIGWLLPALVIEVLELTTFGLRFSIGSFTFLSPVVQLLTGDPIRIVDGQIVAQLTLGTAAIYAAVGAVFTVLAWLHYRVRHVEQAGEAMAYRWARIAFLVLFTAGCTLGFGLIVSLIFSGVSPMRMRSNALALLPGLCVGALLGWFGAQMMLRRTVKVFQARSWGGFGICAAVIAALLLCIRFDVLGVQHYVPAADQVESVELAPEGWNARGLLWGVPLKTQELTLTDEAHIAQTIRLHEAALDAWDRDGNEANTFNSSPLELTYHLKNGRTVRRRFECTDANADALQALLSDPAVVTAYYEANLPEKFTAVPTLTDNETGEWYYCTDVSKLRAAILADAAAGNLRISYYSDEYETKGFLLNIEMREYWITSRAVNTLALFEKSTSEG